ncbi:hypothetical protein [Streptomyces globosus]|uniref:hypothetical protein n=1 Tax=Streptomyces globosus TaxID=68209 RepID=UPI00362F7C1D
MMSQDIREFVPASCGLLGLGEPTHLEPAFGWVRNDLFEQLAGVGFRSVALEIDRVAALAVDDYVRKGRGTLDAVMREGFSHGWGSRRRTGGSSRGCTPTTGACLRGSGSPSTASTRRRSP